MQDKNQKPMIYWSRIFTPQSYIQLCDKSISRLRRHAKLCGRSLL